MLTESQCKDLAYIFIWFWRKNYLKFFSDLGFFDVPFSGHFFVPICASKFMVLKFQEALKRDI